MRRRWAMKAAQHSFRLKMEPQLSSGLHFLDQVAPSPQSKTKARSVQADMRQSHVLRQCWTQNCMGHSLARALLRAPGGCWLSPRVRNGESQSLFVFGKNVLHLGVMTGLWQLPWHHEDSSLSQD